VCHYDNVAYVIQVLDEKQTTVYKRALDTQYQLKLKASRSVFGVITEKFPAMPFTLRALGEEGEKAKEPITNAQVSGVRDTCVLDACIASPHAMH
jgi:hypothetical protein